MVSSALNRRGPLEIWFDVSPKPVLAISRKFTAHPLLFNAQLKPETTRAKTMKYYCLIHPHVACGASKPRILVRTLQQCQTNVVKKTKCYCNSVTLKIKFYSFITMVQTCIVMSRKNTYKDVCLHAFHKEPHVIM